jgi:hypothetical protein
MSAEQESPAVRAAVRASTVLINGLNVRILVLDEGGQIHQIREWQGSLIDIA